MALRDKEQEERIEEVGNKLMNPPTDVQELLLLLDKADNYLSRVEQCPPQSMHTALLPSMKALISRDLLKHSDLDVKVAVASCLSEITRIAAPEAPYNDDLMREIFGLIVGAFRNLDEMSSRSFSKRVSILETVAKVRSCVLMLDLECDDLILDMFHHFLNTIRSKHSYTVFSSMETILTLVIEESENISTSLLLCLLDHLKVDQKNLISLGKKIAEKVLVNCSLKLKPYMDELFRSICAPLNDYSKVVAAVCQGILGTSTQDEIISGETQVNDIKFSDRSHCVKLHQESAKHDHKVVCLEKTVVDTDKAVTDAENVVADANGSSKSVSSNDAFQIGKVNFIVSKPKMELFQPSGQLRDTGRSSLTESDNLGCGAILPESVLNLSSMKGRKRKASGKSRKGRTRSKSYGKRNAVGKAALDGSSSDLSKILESSQMSNAYLPILKSRSKRSKVINESERNLLQCSASKSRPVCAEDGKITSTIAVCNSEANQHTRTRSKKRQLPHTNKTGKRNCVGKSPMHGLSSASDHKGLLESIQTTGGDLPVSVPVSKLSEIIGVLGSSHSGVENRKSAPATSICDSETKRKRHRGKSRSQKEASEVDFSVQKHIDGTNKQQKAGMLYVKYDDKEVKLKELVSLRKLKLNKANNDQILVKNINETQSGRKRSRDTPEKFGTKKPRKSFNGLLVGSKIRVWWPEDERFYDGVVDSFDRSLKKHKILYNDGDVEDLFLKKEKWEPVDVDSKIDEEREMNSSDVIAIGTSNKKSRGRKGKTLSVETETIPQLKALVTDEIKSDSPLKRSNKKSRGRKRKVVSVESKTIQLKGLVADETKSGPPSKRPVSRSNNKAPKRKGRPSIKVITDEAHKNSSNGKIKSVKRRKLGKENVGQSIKPEHSKSNNKVDNKKLASKVVNHTAKMRGNSKCSTKLKNEKPRSARKIGNHTAKVRGNSSKSSIKLKKSDSTETAHQKHGRRPAKGSNQKVRGGRKSKTTRNLNAKAKSTNAKKSKVGRFGA